MQCHMQCCKTLCMKYSLMDSNNKVEIVCYLDCWIEISMSLGDIVVLDTHSEMCVLSRILTSIGLCFLIQG